MPDISDLHRLNPDWDNAVKHGEASKTGMINYQNVQSENGEHIKCACCNEHVCKEPISIWVHSKQLQFLGLGFPLFYEFLKLCMLMLLISIGCYHALSLQKAMVDNYSFCHSSSSSSESRRLDTSVEQTAAKCYTFMINLARIQEQYDQTEQSLRLISFVLQMLTLIYIRNNLIKLQAYYDERSTTLSDYSMIIKGITLKENVQRNILQFMCKQMGDNQPNVQEVILVPDMEELQEMERQRNTVIQKLRPYFNQKGELQEDQQKQILQNQLHTLNNKIKHSAKACYKLMKADKLACERAIIIFNSEQDKINVLDKAQDLDSDTLKRYFGADSRVRLAEAEEPEQIIWENVNLNLKTRIGRIILGWSLSLVLLGAVFTLFYSVLVQKSVLLEEAGQKLVEDPDSDEVMGEYVGSIILVYLLMFLVVLFDKIVLSSLFHKFTDLERHSTTANLQFSFALKYALGLFFTTALMTLATEAIKFHNYYTHEYGVIDEETIMLFMNAIFIPFFWLVNPLRIWKNIKRALKKGKKDMTQNEANKLMEQQSYDLGKRFAEVIQMMWFVYLYSTLIPIGAVIIVAGLGFYYWVDKYNLLRRSKVQGKVSGSFIQTSLTMLDLTLLLRPLGSLIFDYQIRDEDTYFVSNMIMVCVAFVYLIFPKNYWIELLNEELFKPQEKQYKEAKLKFHRNYKTEHPLFSVLDDSILQEDDRNVGPNLCDIIKMTLKNSKIFNLREIDLSENVSADGKETTHIFFKNKNNKNDI